ncbi:Structural maintenance of chromosomes protein 2 [Eumeta japonica]|uniref:Structural maintenance of chromosomes protein n=1 Tax=Eumeta variegata TaxID=151549 RepID=A0A4C1U900_EUMVA|nr:Structural maintenance of chromosomes protein 2 [Eumeta japonica]
MHIKSIVLDGFKSYGNRVEITGFDPEFNAITGLNGTGKSNILDSICFVLGITNLSNVRAGSLQELIYKHGQAGIIKATVSITFDNRDKRQCPIGYENHDEITVTRQVVMGGKNKYLINGINVQNKRVSDLFCSVQLNVNNPHFLIMQGRITKVLNMKPPEILSMVEEAAGTRMYEAKKQAAQKTIEKKDAKLRELNDIIKEDIAPKLQKLQDERSQFQEHQKVVRELENITRLCVAWQYVKTKELLTTSEAQVREVTDEIQDKKDTIKNNENHSKQLDKEVTELNKKIDEESGNVLKELETELVALEKLEASASASQKAASEAVASHGKRARLLARSLTEDDAALTTKKRVLNEASSTFESLRAASDSSAKALAEAQERFLAVSSGLEAEVHRIFAETYGDNALSNTCRDWFQRFKNIDFELEDNERFGTPKKFKDEKLEELLNQNRCQTLRELGKTLQVDESTVSKRLKVLEMIQKQGLWVPYELKLRDIEWRFLTCKLLFQQQKRKVTKKEASEASTRITQNNMEKKHCEGRLKILEKEFNSTSTQFQKDQDNIGRMQADADLTKMNFSEERNETLKTTCRTLQNEIRSKRNMVDRLSATLHRCNFQYRDPYSNFDRSKVAGTVCKLIRVCDSVYCRALEKAAGGKLFNVVVDNEETSKMILQRGDIQGRVTLIPLNKISGSVIDRATLRLAQEVGGGPENVQLALDLISFDECHRVAMEWIFGNTLICNDLDTAKKVTFHPRIKRKCVTLCGDVTDPAGTLSGGAPPKTKPILLQLQELAELEQQLAVAEAQLSNHTKELKSMQQVAESYSATHQRYEVMSHELEVVKARLATTSHAQLYQEIESLREQAARLAASIEEDKIIQRDAATKANDLETKVKDIKGHREREFKKAEQALNVAKKAAEQNSGEWKRREQEFETLRLEVADLERTVATSRTQLENERAAEEQLKEQLQEAEQQLKVAKDNVKEVQNRIKSQKAEIASKNSNIAKLLRHKEELVKINNDLELKIKELEYKIKDLQTEATEREKKLEKLETDHSWISSEREYFGAAGGLYDFQARQANVAGARLQQLKERRDKLARGLNARAHTLLGKEEEQYQDVMRKKKIVEADRAKLVQVMAELDEKKKKTLITACEQVNRDFGSIFSMLLPGAQAKLKPPDGQTVLEGLEVKVGFNNTWKESLGELSGGQRSLVALSLVLAMLLFKPAPLYILDEVDAALDLSHTQNIGQMLKEHFKHSQFIIVSLKDGMFNNANVLFRTMFVDGMSSVQRTVNPRR